MHVPVLALGGTRVVQVSSAENLPSISAALSRNRDVTVRELRDLNHLFQRAKTGGVSEYSQIAESFSPEAMGIVREWIATRFLRR